ncbi:hypothetical protein GDO81_029518 [Engystomops pustulosus]|uniref:Uncharacterized protein n=1 Tax=Engystomops pustulosus TaxID=76066 RepID=A0AAV6Z1B9_ENGPU|nr:hypothetical protein GDO81_029518 [Engystomops pustulosus]
MATHGSPHRPPACLWETFSANGHHKQGCLSSCHSNSKCSPGDFSPRAALHTLELVKGMTLGTNRTCKQEKSPSIPSLSIGLWAPFLLKRV